MSEREALSACSDPHCTYPDCASPWPTERGPCTYEYPMMRCPKCGHEERDYDGFGVLIHDACGYCSHPSASGEPMRCDHCKAEI